MKRLGIIQTDQYTTNEAGIQKITDILTEMGKNETDLVCLPEQWLPDNVVQDFEAEFARFRYVAREFGMGIVPGAFYHPTDRTDSGHSGSAVPESPPLAQHAHKRRAAKMTFSIVAPIIGSDGEVAGMQEKIHPFDYEREIVRPGSTIRIFSVGQIRFGVIVCYDMVFPQVANTIARKGAQVILSPSRIVNAGVSPWSMYVQVRALENRIPILAANVCHTRFGGSSMIVDLHLDDIVTTDITGVAGNRGGSASKRFDLDTYEGYRRERFADSHQFD